MSISTHNSDHYRTFIAIPVEDEAIEKIAEQRDSIKRRFPYVDWHWLSSDQWHLTVGFLGNVSQETIKQCYRSLSPTIKMQQAFKITIEAVIGIPSQRPHCIAMAPSFSPSLVTLQQTVANGCEACGIILEKRTFQPHITLARYKHTSIKSFNDYVLLSPITLPIKKLVMYRSEQFQQGTRYWPLKLLPLFSQ